MTAPKTVPQFPQSHKSLLPRLGVIGYGICVRVARGHLILEDGIAQNRFYGRFPRVGHGLKRLVCISEDGFTTLGALKWLADVGASFVFLNRTGKVLFVTGPTAPSDAHPRHWLALARVAGVSHDLQVQPRQRG